MTEFTKDAPFEFEGVKVYAVDTPGISRDVAVESPWLRQSVWLTTRDRSEVPRDIARALHAFIEAERNAPTFTPLPIPEVGAYISATLRDGRMVEGEVERVDSQVPIVSVWVERVALFINLTQRAFDATWSTDIIAWHPIARPQPEEPLGLGAVVEAGGRKFVRVPHPAVDPRHWMTFTGGWASWDGITKSGPVTVLSEGVVAQ